MILRKEKCRFGITEVILLVLSILLLAGSRSWFAVCAVMSETVMSCHWAGEVLKAVSVVLFILVVVHILVPDEKIKMGMDLALAAFSILTALCSTSMRHITASCSSTCSSIQEWTD